MTVPHERILNGRYAVGDLIGRGGMADVYLGHDQRLNRKVAIKEMRPDLARDPQFQSRFRREAQASAALNHPNIVSVYDTGDEEHQDTTHQGVRCPFIVMEFVDGQTLREKLDTEDVGVDDALRWSRGMLAALDYSHHEGIVHRDIKPGNVMVTRTGQVKVMDFGIARALSDSSATLTQTQAVVGTAQYLSPEQARGEHVDSRSDLYSAGCVLFELLTGRPPFMGDSAVAVAYQHVRENPPQPSVFNPELPRWLDEVVATALAKHPERRFQSGGAFDRALSAGWSGPITEPLPTTTQTAAMPAVGAAALHGHDADGASTPASAATPQDVTADGASGHEPATAAMAAVPAAGVAAMGGAGVARSPEDTGGGTVAGGYGGGHGGGTDGPEPPGDGGGTDRRRRRRRVLIPILVVVLTVVAVIGGYFLLQEMERRSIEASQVQVPTVQGMTPIEAQNTLTSADLRPIIEQMHHDEIARNRAVGTEPAAGSTAQRDQEVTLFVSEGPEQVELPEDLVGQSEATVRDTLEGLGLRISAVRFVTSADVPRDRLAGTSPELGSTVPADSAVELLMSNGNVEVPQFTGLNRDQAGEVADAAGLSLSVTERETSEAADGQILEQSDDAGSEVPQGSTIELVVAVAPEEPSPSPSPESPEPTAEEPSPSPTDEDEVSPTDEASPSPTDDEAAEEPSPSPTGDDPDDSPSPDPSPSPTDED